MSDSKISALLALSLIASPMALPAGAPAYDTTTSSETTSYRTAARRMRHQLGGDYIRPMEANHIDAPLPYSAASDEIVGIYGNILYPQDREQIQQKKLADWFDHPKAPFPLSREELQDISLYILERFCVGTVRHYFAEQVQKSLAEGCSLEDALEQAKQATLARGDCYREMAKEVPAWPGRAEILVAKINECADGVQEIIKRDTKAIRKNPAALQEILADTETDLIEAPFSWDMRTDVLKQMVDKVVSVSPNSPYFLALQEVTPQALGDVKKTLAERNLQWISFNNISEKETLAPREEEVLGEATAFTSTIALSADLEVLKVQLGDLPTESGSVRKILGVRARNTHTGEVINIFSTHTDHKIQNDIYERTAVKIHEFATQFFQDTAEQRFVLGGDLNVFEQLGGAQYVEKLRELFVDSQDFRETDYYAPSPVAWSSFIGRGGDAFAAQIAADGTVERSALDQLIVGNGVELQAAAREAGVYDESGALLDYYKDPERYMEHLRKRVTFSDHFFNVVRFH